MAAVSEAPSLFLRKATGLVKGWSRFDAFLYSFMSVNLVTLGLFFSLAVLGFVPKGQVLPAILLSGVFITFLVIILVLYLVNMLPLDGRAKQIVRVIVIVIGILSLLKYLGVWF